MSGNAQGLRFQIRFPDGRSEVLTVDSDRVIVGSGAHCEIRLPSEHAAVEHLDVLMTATGPYAQARTFERMPTINGVEFSQSPIPAGSVVGVGGMQMLVSVVSIDDNANVIKKKAQKSSPVIYLVGIAALPLAYFVMTMDETSSPVGQTPKDVPALWSKTVDPCPVNTPDQAAAKASDLWLMAESKAERRPFRIQDGVASVGYYENAAACFKVAARAEQADAALAAADALRTKVNEDYRAHQVRLEHALSVSDFETALREVKILRAFTEGQRGSYVNWLSDTDRKLQLQLNARRKS